MLAGLGQLHKASVGRNASSGRLTGQDRQLSWKEHGENLCAGTERQETLN